MKLLDSFSHFRNSLHENRIKRNRFYLLVVTLMIIADYLMICFHVERNPLTVFPPLPVIDKREPVDMYLPNRECSTLLNETRYLQKDIIQENFITQLVYNISRGSRFENTRINVPADCIVREVWLYDTTCVIDLRMTSLKNDTVVVEGSEELFRTAVKKTIFSHFNTIKDVIILENGIYNRNLWEF